MAKKKDEAPGIKSALELAMERMAGKEGEIARLTSEQKAAIAEIESETKARIAEEEILLKDRLRAALGSEDPEAADKVREEHVAEIARLRERGEAKKRKVRAEGA